MNQFALKIFLFVLNHVRIIGKNDDLLGDPEMKFLVVNRNATESTSAALNFVPAMKNAQVVARTVIIPFVKVFLF